MRKRIWKVLLISICVLSFAAFSIAYAQQKKTGGGDIKYEAKGSSGPVLFSHESHVTQHKAKCTDCHTKIFKMKKEDLKMTKRLTAKISTAAYATTARRLSVKRRKPIAPNAIRNKHPSFDGGYLLALGEAQRQFFSGDIVVR